MNITNGDTKILQSIRNFIDESEAMLINKFYDKIISDLEYNKKQIEQEFAVGKVSDDKIEAKANELQKIIKSLEEKEEQWFELSSKME